MSPTIERRRIHTSFVQRLPLSSRYYRQYLPVFPTAVEQFDFDRFDAVISVSHCAVKSIVRPGRVPHLCYCLTPMRYAWDQFDQYFGGERIGRVPSAVMRGMMARMARWDRDTANRADRYVAISHHVAGRIHRYYNREATVVYPPVDTDFFQPAGNDVSREGQRFALIVSALVPYKRVDLAIEACRLARVPLTIAGDGPERARLERMAMADRGAGAPGVSDVTFVGRRSDEEIRDLYRRASVLLMPGEEDFGIVPVEAQACGTPVVALARGGALETVVHGETGSLVEDDAPQAFADAIAQAIDRPFDRRAIRAHAERFSRGRFVAEMSAIIASTASGRPGQAP